MRYQMSEQYKGIGMEAFFEMATEVACKNNKDLDQAEALEKLCEMF